MLNKNYIQSWITEIFKNATNIFDNVSTIEVLCGNLYVAISFIDDIKRYFPETRCIMTNRLL